MEAFILWTEQQEQELKRLFTTLVDGSYMSHRYIGALLGKSRNAVVGKVHRLQLKRDPLVTCRGIDNRIADTGQPKQRKKKDDVAVLTTKTHRTKTSRAPHLPAYGGASMAGEAMAGRSPYACTILEVNEYTCKFPIGHVGQEGFHLCGDRVGNKKPYCVFHAALCYTPVPQRRDTRPHFVFPR